MSTVLRTGTNILLCFALLPTTMAMATTVAADRDPPGVARVAAVEGPVSYRLAAEERWVGVAINAPLVTGDGLYVGEAGRAEIQLAAGTHLRVGGLSQIELVELAPDATQVRVVEGSAILRLRADPRGRHVELDTPEVALLIEEAGDYRVDVGADGRTRLRVGRGRAVAWSDAGRFEVGRETVASFAAGDRTELISMESDELDAWDERRTRRIDAARSYRYVSEEIYGAEDLDEYGVWEERDGYGALWRPTVVAPDWAPYRNGRWIWVSPWGWTWLDDAAWGWAPFHYGRWVRLDGRWYWGPGPRVARPVYAPALVGFYGAGVSFGSSLSISIGLSSSYVGWVPLGWGEPCNPWWGGFGGARIGSPWWGGWGGPRVVNHVYIDNRRTHPTHVRHVNRAQPGGFSMVSREGFGRGDRVEAPRRGMGREFRQVGGRVGVTPARSARRAVARRSIGQPSARPSVRADRPGVGSTVASHSEGRRVAARSRAIARPDSRSIPRRARGESPSVRSVASSQRAAETGGGVRSAASRSRRPAVGFPSGRPSLERGSVRASQTARMRSVPASARTVGRRAIPFVASRPRSEVTENTSPKAGRSSWKDPARRLESQAWSDRGGSKRSSASRSISKPSQRSSAGRSISKPSKRSSASRSISKPSKRSSAGRSISKPSKPSSGIESGSSSWKKSASALRSSSRPGRAFAARPNRPDFSRSRFASSSLRAGGGRANSGGWRSPGRRASGSSGGRLGLR